MKHVLRWSMVGFFVFALSSQAFSAGFALIEQSVKGLGTAFSGASAIAEDPSTVYFNPAGMTLLEGQQIQAAAHVIVPSAKFSGTAATSPALGSIPISGNDGGQGGLSAVAPNLYYTYNPGNGWVYGIGINAPFGMATEYDDGWVGRYHALKSDVKTININPSVAYRVNENLSLGAGVNAQYLDAELSNAVDFGSIAFAQSGGALGTPTQQDGKVVLKADDWAYGFNLGALYEFSKATRVGVSYRSRMEYTVEGDADFTVPASITALPVVGAGLTAAFADTPAKADITLPDSASVSVYHRLNPQWALMADVTWTHWSVFDELRVEFDSGLADNVTNESWEDNWRYSVGATFNPNEQLTLRGGLAYDETPIPDAHRTPRIPGSNRFWVALGAGYAYGAWNFDIGYAHLFVDEAPVELKAGVDPTSSDFFRGDLTGEFDNAVDIASVEVSYKF